jgi:hypothetical protein
MGFKLFTPLLFLFVIAGFPAFSQRDSVSLATIVSQTEKLATGHPFEKVYLHFDKPYYAAGDTIWFKAYLTVGAAHQASGLSRIIYVDVISAHDSLVKTLKLPAINGTAFGDITLSPALFKQGNYHIRAYTNWMRNFGTDYFFNKTITIGNVPDNFVTTKISFTKTKKNSAQFINAKVLFKGPDGNPYGDKKVTWTIQSDDETINKGKGVTDKDGVLNLSFTAGQSSSSDASKLITIIDLPGKRLITNTFPLKSAFAANDVQFFPEGGDLITGVRSKVAFKAISPAGLGVNVIGTVTDNTGAEVAGFTTQHAGMGIFALLPENGKTYKAIVTFPDGSKSDFDLPKIRTDGINLAVNNNDADNLTVKVATNQDYFKMYQNKTFYIVAQSGGTIYYTGKVALQSQVYTGVVAKSKFPTGILQVTLFAVNGEPLSERIVFIQHNDALNLSLSANLPAYTARQHVKISVLAKNKALPVEGSFSVAVIDETKVPYDENAETTILSSLLLTSDLRGYIEKPNYYFNHPDPKALTDLDILMLTQGYRRFSYTNILAGKYPPITFLPERGIEVTGTLRTASGMPVNKGNVNLQVPDRGLSVNATTDGNGLFKFSNVAIFDSSKVVLSARNNPGNSNLMIMADLPRSQAVTKNYNDPDAIANIDSSLNAYLQNSKKQRENSHVLKEVVIRSTKITSFTHENYSALTGLSMMADQMITGERLKNCGFDILGCLEGTVFGIWHVDDKFYVKRDYDAGNKKPIQFFVNGLAVDNGYISAMNPENIGSIEVYLKDGVSGINRLYDSNGIISISTKNGTFTPTQAATDLQPLTTQTNVVTLMPKGFYKARVFYSPKYDNIPGTVQQMGDLRTTIYWSPNIITDKNGNATFDFFNADGRGTYRAVIEGIDNDGNIGRGVLRYNVR